ncbi:hypothetical protein GGI07_000882 [Coemansia sp. Benny D115]|nr:hypothetical protein GGI07_000882 [Coemansia sp. Benny D115]
MTGNNNAGTDGAIGYMQRKSRFYGWAKHLVLLDHRGLTRLFPEQLPKPMSKASTEETPIATQAPPSLIIGSTDGFDLKHIAHFKRKVIFRASQLTGVSIQGQRDIVFALKSEKLILRPLNPGDRDMWLEAIQFYIKYKANTPDTLSQNNPNDVDSHKSMGADTVDNEVQSIAPSHRSVKSRRASIASAFGFGGANISGDSASDYKDDRNNMLAIADIPGQENAMGWLPSMTNLVEVPQTPVSQTTVPNSVDEQSTMRLEKYATSPQLAITKAPTLSAGEFDFGSTGISLDAKYFESEVFSNNDSQSVSASSQVYSKQQEISTQPLLPLSSLSSPLPSPSPSSSPTPHINANNSYATAGTTADSTLPANNTARLLTVHMAIDFAKDLSLDQPSDYSFGDIFDFVQTPHTPLSACQDSETLHMLGTESMRPPTSSPQNTHAESALTSNSKHDTVGSTYVAKLVPSNSNAASTIASGLKSTIDIGNNTDNVDDDDEQSDLPLMAILVESASKNPKAMPNNKNTMHSVPSTLSPVAAPIIADPADSAAVANSSIVLSSSVTDFTGALLSDIGISDWYSALDSNAPVASNVALPGTGASQMPASADVLNTDLHNHESGAHTTNAPENQAAVGQDLVSHHQQNLSQAAAPTMRAPIPLDEPARPAGAIQTLLTQKYSESLNSSRAHLPSIGRSSRAAALLDKRDIDRELDNVPDCASNQRMNPIVQYQSSKQPANTGVAKVVRGQLTKEVIQKEADRRSEASAVRRMRRVKSESKIVPLKAIRLKLNGSIVGNNDSVCSSQNNGTKGLLGEQEMRSKMSLADNASRVADAYQHANPGDSSVKPSADVYGGFNEIQERLRLAEEQKKLEQRARIFDKDAVDSVRIADIIENRQDVPLAVQLEQRRQVQLAKQQALVSQQLEQQRKQLELERMQMEQQMKYQDFKRQSLHPSIYSGNSGHASQWPQQQGIYNNNAIQQQQFARPKSSQGYNTAQFAGYGHVATSRGVTRPGSPMTIADPGADWAYSQQYVESGRPISGYVSHYSQQSGQGRQLLRSHTTNARRQVGNAFVNQHRSVSRGAESVRSKGSTDSWQSQVDHQSAHASVHAKTDPIYAGSVFISSPEFAPANVNRTLSYGHASRRSSNLKRTADFFSKVRMNSADKNIPPVPSLPSAVRGHGNHSHMQMMAQGPPAYTQQTRGHWEHSSPMSAMAGRSAKHHVSQQIYGDEPYMYGRGHTASQGMVLDMQALSRKRTEMAADTPSLLQRLDQARVIGVLPGRYSEKMPYSQGAYQNRNMSQITREVPNAQNLGDGNTLLIDRVYESERNKTAFLRKISRTYSGIGGNAAPAPMFMH